LAPPGHGQSALKGWRDTVMTRQPPALNFFTVAWPMPRLAPVSTKVRVLSSKGAAVMAKVYSASASIRSSKTRMATRRP
jgi:hypothetical protein